MSVRDDILRVLNASGPLPLQGLHEATKQDKKSIENALYDLRRLGKVARSEDGKYRALIGPPEPETLTTPPVGGHPTPAATPAPGDVPGPQAEASKLRQPLSGDQDRFRALLQDCDVRKALDTITETFFAGDPEDLNHLASVLEDARAYVQPLQKRMIVRYWARFIHRDVPPILEERLSHPEGEKGERSRPGSEFVEDIGWKVEKDKDGDWVPRPGGELTYEKALRYATTMNASRSSSEDEGEEEDEGSTGGKRRRRGRDPILTLLISRAFPEKNGSDDRISRLEQDLAHEREERARDREQRLAERFDQIEGLVTTLANRDPLQDYLGMKERLVAIEGGPRGPVVTDQSPVVQLYKDTTDKMDRNVNRLVGIMERAMLRGGEEFVPEETSTPEEREQRAAHLLEQVGQHERSRQLRREVFGR